MRECVCFVFTSFSYTFAGVRLRRLPLLSHIRECFFRVSTISSNSITARLYNQSIQSLISFQKYQFKPFAKFTSPINQFGVKFRLMPKNPLFFLRLLYIIIFNFLKLLKKKSGQMGRNGHLLTICSYLPQFSCVFTQFLGKKYTIFCPLFL